MPGLSSWSVGGRSAAPVEAVNELRLGGVGDHLARVDVAERIGTNAAGGAERADGRASGPRVVAIVPSSATFGLHEQTRQEVELVFKAASDEEAVIGLAGNRKAGGFERTNDPSQTVG